MSLLQTALYIACCVWLCVAIAAVAVAMTGVA
jgi:hypothetical protein